MSCIRSEGSPVVESLGRAAVSLAKFIFTVPLAGDSSPARRVRAVICSRWRASPDCRIHPHIRPRQHPHTGELQAPTAFG